MATPKMYANTTRFGNLSERTGGSFDTNQPATTTELRGGSHMPLDTDMHWSWSNPLNIIPLFMVLVFLIALFGALL